MLCSIFFYVFVLCLSFIFSFILHPSCIIPLLISSFLSLLPLDCFVYSWQKRGEYTGLYRHFYMTHVHTLRGSNSTSCTFVRGESYRRDAYTKGEKTFSLFCFGLYYTCALVGSCFLDANTSFILHWLCVGLAFIFMLLCFIGCMFRWSFALLYNHCSHFHMIVCVWSSYSYFSHHVYLIAFYLLHYTCPFITWFILRV